MNSVDCLKCGVCCIAPTDQDVFCNLDAADLKRLPKSFVRRNVRFTETFDLLRSSLNGMKFPHAAIKCRWRKVKAGPLRQMNVCACVALKGDPLHRVKCSVYAERARACREAVVPGDKYCLAIRRSFLKVIEAAY